MTDSGGRSCHGLFAGTAWYYARYRPGYPTAFLEAVVQRFGLDGSGRLLDLGCGSGQLTIPLAAHVSEAVGVDPEHEMLVEAARQARTSRATNVTWIPGSSADLPDELGRFRLVTMGRSFHWMDRQQVLGSLAGMLDAGGGLVIANDSCLVRPATAWQHAIEEVQRRFVRPVPPSGGKNLAQAHEPHEAVLARSPFQRVDRTAYEFARTWTPHEIIGYLYSTSLPLRRLLGNRRPAFEQAVTDALLAIDQSGQFVEPVTLEVFMASRE